MSILISNFWLLLLAGLFFINKENKQTFIYIATITLVIIRSLAEINSVPDLSGYQSGFYELSEMKLQDVATGWLYTLKCPEIGFRYLMKFASYISMDFHVCLFIIAVLTIVPYMITIKNYSPYVIISVLVLCLGIYNQSIFVLRQHLAMAVLLLSYPYVISRDLKRFLIFCVMAFLCHQTALVFLPVYFIYGLYMQNNRKFIISIMGIAVILSLVFGVLLNYFVVGLKGYESYNDSNDASITSFLISISYLLAYIIFCKHKIFEGGIYRLVFVLHAINSITLLFGWQFTGMPRLMMYYSNSIILLIPIIASNIRFSMIRYSFLLAVMVLLYYLSFFGSGAESLKYFQLIY